MITLQYIAFRIWLALARRFPRAAVWILDKLAPRLRQTALHNLRMCGYEDAEAVAGGVFASIARLASSFARFPEITRANVHDWIRYEGLEHFTVARDKGRGVLVATAHLGNWELSAFAHALMTAPMHIVVRPLDNPKIDAFVARCRALSGNRIIPKQEAARKVLRALEAGEAVGILIDQNVTLEEGVFVDFFGIPACAGTHFSKFAHHTGAAVVPGFALWSHEERKHVLRFYPEIPMSGDVQADTQRLHSFLESVIRQHPDQWLWVHRRWKTRPPGEPPLY